MKDMIRNQKFATRRNCSAIDFGMNVNILYLHERAGEGRQQELEREG